MQTNAVDLNPRQRCSIRLRVDPLKLWRAETTFDDGLLRVPPARLGNHSMKFGGGVLVLVPMKEPEVGRFWLGT